MKALSRTYLPRAKLPLQAMDLFELFILLLLLVPPIMPVEGYTSLLQIFRFPHAPASSGMHYIHSPEFFLPAHGLCGPGFALESTHQPEMSGDYALLRMTYQTTLDGRMHARVFSNNANQSHFMLTDDQGRECVMGQLRMTRLGGGKGFGLRCYASRIRTASIWDVMVGTPDPRPEYIESAVHAGASGVREDANLGAYRRLVMKLGVA